ncbi:hypothetical protein BN2476_80126 [Paraburkholderia piptadeniae]|uniref:Uncharacterized protein n=1 Tax=Paraburkholderia piptadeniae TaxID=1701573 RepID=A0A1N7RMC0_9BURK|nr:hypothetical protein BN2476_80126 [Paraburkholderia piptadeniae]
MSTARKERGRADAGRSLCGFARIMVFHVSQLKPSPLLFPSADRREAARHVTSSEPGMHGPLLAEIFAKKPSETKYKMSIHGDHHAQDRGLYRGDFRVHWIAGPHEALRACRFAVNAFRHAKSRSRGSGAMRDPRVGRAADVWYQRESLAGLSSRGYPTIRPANACRSPRRRPAAD